MDFHEVKEKALNDEVKKKEFKERMIDQNKMKHDIVQSEERRINNNLQMYENLKIKRTKNNYSIRVENVDKEISGLDHSIAKLEKKEKELLDKLKNS